jgi:hypothetical protein
VLAGFRYKVNDGKLDSNTALVRIEVHGRSPTPIPTLGDFGMLILTMSLLAFGMRRMRAG